MAAYAALNSLMYILQQIQHHPRPPITLEKQHMDSLCEIIRLLQDFLENYSHRDIGDGKEALESQIAYAAYAAEDVIETHIVDQILAKSNFQEDDNFIEEDNFIDLFDRDVKKIIRTLARSSSHKTGNQIRTGDGERNSNSLFCQDLQKVIEDMYLINKEVIEIQEKFVGINDDQPPRHIISMSTNIIGSSTATRKHTNTMVGLDDVLIQIMDRLTGHPPNRQVLPIIGMGGIGKTTLARHAYNNPLIVHHFHIRIWVTISQEYKHRDILLEALSCVGQLYQKDENKREHELEELLYKSLCGKIYLVILDDMWGIKSWERLRLFFPDNNNGSRIIVTTRLSNVADNFAPNGFKMKFLEEDESWDLFRQIVFPQDHCCPPELEDVGKNIARNCKGLPLSIAVIGGLLANSEKTQKYWEYIVENVNTIVNLEDDMHCLQILYLSYNHLPIHLKPCFLYMGVFPEDKEIVVSSLKNLWVAEGFLKPIPAKSLEVVAEEYLKDLIDRNLILVHTLGCSGKVKCCKIHDLLRDLCLREGKKDKFLWVSKVSDFYNLEGIQSQHRISVHKDASEEYGIDRVLKALQSASLARSLIFNFKGDNMLSHSLRLVRVFNMGGNSAYWVWKKYVAKSVNSRWYLDFTSKWKSNSIIPSSIHLLWNLQTLIIDSHFGIVDISPEFWKMSQLRYVNFRGNLRNCQLHLPDVPLINEGDVELILKNLHTLKGIINLRLSEEVIKRIPNIKKLHVSYIDLDEGWWHNYCLNNLALLNELESLFIYWSINYSERRFQIELVKNLIFPHSLKKLTLNNTNLLWEDMSVIGSLPYLQVLKLTSDAFCGTEWNPFEDEFLCLKFLLIEDCDELVYWNANRTHFPCLEQLALNFLYNLEEIPLDIGHISTLRSIELLACGDSVVISANNLRDEQVGLGNKELQVQIY